MHIWGFLCIFVQNVLRHTFLCYKDLSTLWVNAKVRNFLRIGDLAHNAVSQLGI